MELTPSMIGILGFAAIFLLILLKMPIAIAFGIVGFLGFAHLSSFEGAMTTLITTVWSYGTSYVLMAVPLFILMGQFASYSKIGGELYETAAAWFGRLPGGLAIGTIWGSAAFAACTGSSGAGILTFGPIAYKPMENAGYDKRLTLGTLCCGATLGGLIPPSITFIIYGSITDESVGRLFMAGVIPGLMEAALYSIAIIFLAASGIWAAPAGAATTWKEKLISLKGTWGFLSLMILVIGGIYAGFFTPTEAAGIGSTGSLLILLFRKGFKWALIRSAMLDSLRTSCMAFTIIIFSVVFARFVTLTGLNFLVLDLISNSGASPMAIMWLLIMLMFIMGFVLPVTTIIVLIVPFIYPIVTGVLGFDGIWFGVIVCILAEIALITPPIGMNLFTTLGIFQKEANTYDLFQGVTPFIIVDVIRLILIVLFPQICLWLPQSM
ncbi:MAG: TRAP transporter large permease [Deltaproteobacteria bacterium]|nr:TRAP transporter large permease [Deltaproteobacteria bacterium]